MTDSLSAFLNQVTGESHLRVEKDLGGGFVRLRVAEAERRQAKHDIRKSEDIVIEMLRNSRDAHASNIFVACWKDDGIRNITFIDDGNGIPSSMHEMVFEPRVTSKLDSMNMDFWGVHGRGMALYAIKSNTLISRISYSKENVGTVIHIQSDTGKLPERTDQSTSPTFKRSKTGVITATGPKNILRTVSEFAYVHRDVCNIYFGSPSEIAASLRCIGNESSSRIKIRFERDEESLLSTLIRSSNPDDFAHAACMLDLPMSSRTARRVLDGTIEPAQKLEVDLDLGRKFKSGSKMGNDSACKRDATSKVSLTQEDTEVLEEAINLAFKKVASNYYLNPNVNAYITTSKGEIVIKIPTIPLD